MNVKKIKKWQEVLFSVGAMFAIAGPMIAQAAVYPKTISDVSHSSLDTAVADAKKNGVNVVKDADQTKEVTPGQVVTSQKDIAADYVTQSNSLNNASKNYSAAKSKYNKDLAAYNTAKTKYENELKHPQFRQGGSWTDKQIRDFVGDDLLHLNYIKKSNNTKKPFKFDDSKAHKATQKQINFSNAHQPHGWKGDVGSWSTSRSETLYDLHKGDQFAYRHATVDVRTGKDIDVILKINNTAFRPGTVKGFSPLAIVYNNQIAVNEVTPLDHVDYTVMFQDSETHQPMKIDALMGFGDIDGGQYVSINNADKMLAGSKLKVNGKTAQSAKADHDNTDGKDTRYQAWYLKRNSASMNMTYGYRTTDKLNEWGVSDYFNVGMIDFVVIMPTPPPAKPTAPEQPTVHYHYTHLTTTENIVAPTKDVYSNASPQVDINGKDVYAGQTVNYKINQHFGEIGKDIVDPYTSVSVTDVLPENTTLAGSTADSIKLLNLDSNGNVVGNGDSYLTKAYDAKTRKVTVSFNSNFLNNKNFYNHNWSIMIKAKIAKNSALKNGTEFVNQGHYIINGHDQPSNQVTNNYQFHPTVPNPTKTVNETGDPTGKTQVWTVNQQVSQMDVTTGEEYESFSFSDTLDNRLSYVSAKVLDGNDKDVTTTAGTLNYKGQQVSYTFNKAYLDKMPMNSEHYKLQITTKVSSHQAAGTIYNSALTNINGQQHNTNPAKVVVPPVNNTIHKDLVATHLGGYADTNSVDYKLTSHIGNTAGLNSVEIKDNLEKVFDHISGVKITGKIKDDNGGQHDVDLTNKFTNKTTGRNLDLVLNDPSYKSLLVNSDVTVTFTGKILPYTDYSDYTEANGNISVPNQGNLLVNNQKIDSNIVRFNINQSAPYVNKTIAQPAISRARKSNLDAVYDKPLVYQIEAYLGNGSKVGTSIDVSDNVPAVIDLQGDRASYKVYETQIDGSDKDITADGQFVKAGNKLSWKMTKNPQQYMGHILTFEFQGTIHPDVDAMQAYVKDNLNVPNQAIMDPHFTKGIYQRTFMSNIAKAKMPNIYTITSIESDFKTGNALNGRAAFNVEGSLVAKDRESQIPSAYDNGVAVTNIDADHAIKLTVPAVSQGANKIFSQNFNGLAVPSNNNFRLKTDSGRGVNPEAPYLITRAGTTEMSHDYKTDYRKPTKGDLKLNERQTPVEETLYYYSVTHDNETQVRRQLHESLELNQQKTLSAKAGYGIKDTSVLNVAGWHLNTDQSKFAGLYDMNFKSDDSDKVRIFMKNSYIAGHTVRRPERLDFTSKTGTKLFSSKGLDEYDSLNKKEQALADQREKQLNWLPNLAETQISYRFNQRDLRNGYQSYNMDANHNKTQNYNNDNEIKEDVPHVKVTNGGYRNYISNFVPNGNYEMDYDMLKPLGANELNFKTVRTLNIYGHRYLSKENGYNSENDEIGLQPTISGDNQQDLDGFTAKDKQWLRDNNVKGVKP